MNNIKKERRSAADVWVYLVRILAITSWALFIIAVIVSYYAAPEHDFGFLRYHDIKIRKFWLTPLTGYLYLVLLFSALSSYFCLILDKYRNRRQNDSKHFNILLLMMITIAWVLFILSQIFASKTVTI